MTNLRGVLAASGLTSAPAVLALSALVLVTLGWLGRKLAPSDAFLFVIAASCLLSYHLFLHDLTLLLLPLLLVVNSSVEHAHYLGLLLAAVIIVLPEAAMMIGSANALWVCFLLPVLLLLILGKTLTRSSSNLIQSI
jgi:hypothetical protein